LVVYVFLYKIAKQRGTIILTFIISDEQKKPIKNPAEHFRVEHKIVFCDNMQLLILSRA